MSEKLKPLVEKKEGWGEDFHHPAFGLVSVTRTQGGAVLAGSEFNHGNFIVLRVEEARQNRNLSGDRFFGERNVAEISMTESQWATLLCSMNTTGVPCTINSIDGKRRPQIERSGSNKTDQFQSETAEKMESATSHIKKALEELDKTKLSQKAKRQIQQMLEKADQEISKNMDFVAKQFTRHMEKTVAEAKMEIEGYIQMRGISGNEVLSICTDEKEEIDQ